MKIKDLLLLLLTIIFFILSIFYIVSVCNYDIKELFIANFSAQGRECNLDNIIGRFSTLNSDAKYTSQVLRSGSTIEDYHINLFPLMNQKDILINIIVNKLFNIIIITNCKFFFSYKLILNKSIQIKKLMRI